MWREGWNVINGMHQLIKCCKIAEWEIQSDSHFLWHGTM